MPSCSTAKNPRGHLITFTEEDHRYFSNIDGKDITYTSGTQFLQQFYPQFDPDGSITERCAKKEGLTVESLKEKWAAKGKESCRLGTRMHECCEDIFLGNKLRNIPENDVEKKRFDNAINMSKKILSRADIIGVEKIVFSPELRIAGTIDCLAKSKNSNTYLIIDHKSNERIETYNAFNKFCLDPISHIPAINYHEYSLQLNLYKYLLKKEGYVPKNAQFRLFLNHVTPKEAKLIELPDYQNEIKDMIIQCLERRA